MTVSVPTIPVFFYEKLPPDSTSDDFLGQTLSDYPINTLLVLVFTAANNRLIFYDYLAQEIVLPEVSAGS